MIFYCQRPLQTAEPSRQRAFWDSEFFANEVIALALFAQVQSEVFVISRHIEPFILRVYYIINGSTIQFLKNSCVVPGPRIELGTPASSGQRSTNELTRHKYYQYKELSYFILIFLSLQSMLFLNILPSFLRPAPLFQYNSRFLASASVATYSV